jgi:hypothetical protein
MVKLDADMLPTVPDAPPEAGPDRALDPPPPDPAPPAVAEGDMARATQSPITTHSSAAATIHPLLLLDSNRRSLVRGVWSTVVVGFIVGFPSSHFYRQEER